MRKKERKIETHSISRLFLSTPRMTYVFNPILFLINIVAVKKGKSTYQVDFERANEACLSVRSYKKIVLAPSS